MKLPADYSSMDVKLVAMVHELSRRLLNGNGLGVVALGITDGYSPTIIELQHRLSYLFEYDVMYIALGEEGGKICRKDGESIR